MEEIQKVETAETENNAGKVETVATKKEQVAEKTFTQKQVNEMVLKRLERAEKEWEKKYKQSENQKNVVDKSELFEMQKQLAKYERELALSRYPISDEFKEFVQFKILRNVGKDKSYSQAIDEFFADEQNKRFLANAENKKINTPRVQNMGNGDESKLKSQAIRTAMGLK